VILGERTLNSWKTITERNDAEVFLYSLCDSRSWGFKLKGQKPSFFFEDGQGARLPVAGTVPHSSDDGVFSVEFGEGRTGYYYTGTKEGYYGTGMPEELELTATITNGRSMMGPYKSQIPAKDRWAIVAYVRALQESREVPLSELATKEESN